LWLETILAGASMPDLVDALILDLLEWIGPQSRPYREVIDAWRTSCPRLPVWEEANERGFIAYRHFPGSEAMVSVAGLGAEFLANSRRNREAEPAQGADRQQEA
jgi:hypothetical protein